MNVLWRISARSVLYLGNQGSNRMAGIKHVINDEQVVALLAVFYRSQSVNPDINRPAVDTGIGSRPDGDVIRFDSVPGH